MAALDRISQIKTDIDAIVGQKILLKANKGRKKIYVREGILEETYPSLFVVRLTGEEPSRKLSFTYTDVLTNTVRIAVIDPESESIGDFTENGE